MATHERARRDPADEWLWLHERNEDEMQDALKRGLSHLPRGAKAEDFTCHECKLRLKCTLAYDSWNTNGDCLLDK